jgi:RNA polymerase sigma-70 factor (ECF subfamily)
VGPLEEAHEDADTALLVEAAQAGNQDAFSALYARYFARVSTYLRLMLNDAHEAEDATQDVFMQLMEKLPAYEHRAQPFRAWLFVVVRNHAINHLRKQAPIELVEPVELDRRRELEGENDEAAAWTLEWIKDSELFLLFERLPLTQRQVLALRFLLGLDTKEIAATLGVTETNVRGMQYRGLTFLRKRLKALGRIGEGGELIRMRAKFKQAPVLRSRRFMLDK